MGIKWLEHQPISQFLLLTKAKQHFLLKFIPPEIHSYGVIMPVQPMDQSLKRKFTERGQKFVITICKRMGFTI